MKEWVFAEGKQINVCSASLDVISEAKKTGGFVRPSMSLSGKPRTQAFDARLAELVESFRLNPAMSADWPHYQDIVGGMAWMSDAIGLARRISAFYDDFGSPVRTVAFENRVELRTAVAKWRIIERQAH